MMASNNIDIPLDTFIKHTKKVGFPQKRLQQQRGLRTSGGGGVGGPQKRLSVEFKGQTGDLRAKLGGKKKADIVDLRAKLKPKALSTKQLKSKLTSAQNSQRPQKIKSEQFTLQSQPSRKSDPGPVATAASHKRRKSPVRLPTYEEAKKISVTVPGLNKPVSQPSLSSYRREERLATAIARSKEHRHENYMHGREEYLASAITSAFGGPSASSTPSAVVGERERHSMGGGGGGGGMYSSRGGGGGGGGRFSRSPSPIPDLSYDGQFGLRSAPPIAPPPPPPPSHQSKGLTTVTAMHISNLSDTVSKNDVGELCSAVGPLESVRILGPGIAEVVFKYKDDALEAFKKYNQRNLDGQPMFCRIQAASRTRLSAPAGTSGLGGGAYGGSYGSDFYGGHSSGFY